MTTEQPKRDFFDNFSARNREFCETKEKEGFLKNPSFKISVKQRDNWFQGNNPMRSRWPADLTWLPETVKTRQNEWRFYLLSEKPHKMGPKYINKYPHVVSETLQLLADMLDRKTPTFCVNEKISFHVSHDGHLVVLPTHKLEFDPADKCNFVDLADIGNLFDSSKIKKALNEIQLMRKVCALLKEEQSVTALNLLCSEGYQPTPIPDPAVQELDLCDIHTIQEFVQRLADHPKYMHLVQDEHGEIRNDITIDCMSDDPIAIKFQELQQAENIVNWRELSDYFEEQEEEQGLGQLQADFMEISDEEDEEEEVVQPDAQYVTLDGGMRVMLTAKDLAVIKANHTTSTTRTMDVYYPDRFLKTESTMELLSVSISIERFVDARAYFDDIPAIVKRERPDAADLVMPESSPKYIRLE